MRALKEDDVNSRGFTHRTKCYHFEVSTMLDYFDGQNESQKPRQRNFAFMHPSVSAFLTLSNGAAKTTKRRLITNTTVKS